MKEANIATLRACALNVEEASTNPGILLDNEGDDKGSSPKIQKSKHIPKKNNHGGGNNKNNNKKSILKGSDPPLCSLCGKNGHTEQKCLKKKRAAQEAKEQVKEHNKKFTSNRGTTDRESSNFAQQISMFIQFEEYKKFQKSQKKAASKRNIRNSKNRRRKTLASATIVIKSKIVIMVLRP
jgi:hypothetical protein